MIAANRLSARLRPEIERFDAHRDLATATPPPASWYTDPEFQELERHTTFARHWQFAGRLDQLVAPGDYFTGSILNRPHVVVRDGTGTLRAFHNVCAHHGTRVANGCGNTDAFTCPYHGWQYHLTGGLKRAPRAGAIAAFRTGTVGLPPIHVKTWGPFVLIHAGEPTDLAALAAERPGLALDAMQFVVRRSFELPCNWKVFVDNYLDGGYHVPVMHPALAASLDLEAYTTRLGAGYSVQSCPSTGDRLGERATYFFVHPNFMINRYGSWMDTNLVLPRGVDRCTVVFDYYHVGPVAEDALARELADSQRVQREDTEIVTRVQEGLRSGVYTGLYAPRFEAPMLQFHRLLAADFTTAVEIGLGAEPGAGGGSDRGRPATRL